MKSAELLQERIPSFGSSGFKGDPTLWLSSVFLSMLACKTIYSSMKAFSPVCFASYARLSKSEKVEWDNRAFSTAHAIVVTTTAAYLLLLSNLFQDDNLAGPVVFRSSLLSQIVLGVSIGYFVSDLAMILWFYPSLGGKEYIVHHLLSMISLSLSLYTGQGHFYSYLVLFSEITTPCVNLRWYLNMARLKNSEFYAINGILLFFGWLVGRILLFIYFSFHLHAHYDEVKQMLPACYHCIVIAPPCLTLMNLYWFYKITKGMIQTLSKKERAS